MKLLVHILPDFNGKVSVLDDTRCLLDGYIPETSEEEYQEGNRFKYSSTFTINTLSYHGSLEEKLLKTAYSEHTEDLDIAEFVVDKDGYYIINHFIIPSVEWLNKVSREILDSFRIIYVTDGRLIYKYVDRELKTVDIEEIIEVNPDETTISKKCFDIFVVDKLRHCFASIAKNVLDSMMQRCVKLDNTLRFNRDFLLMTLFVIDILVSEENYEEAQLILEQLGCYDFCPDYEVESKKGCGCKKL